MREEILAVQREFIHLSNHGQIRVYINDTSAIKLLGENGYIELVTGDFHGPVYTIKGFDQLPDDSELWADARLPKLVYELRLAFDLYKKSCRCKTMNSLSWVSGEGWNFIHGIPYRYCPECGDKAPTLANEDDEILSRFEKLLI